MGEQICKLQLNLLLGYRKVRNMFVMDS
jgi:hypothetical protein